MNSMSRRRLLATLATGGALCGLAQPFPLLAQDEGSETDEPTLQENQVQGIRRTYMSPDQQDEMLREATGFAMIVYDSRESLKTVWDEALASATVEEWNFQAQLESDHPDLASLGDDMVVQFTDPKSAESLGLNFDERVVYVREGRFVYVWRRMFLGADQPTENVWQAHVDFIVAASANIKDNQDTYTQDELFAMLPDEDELPEGWTFDPEDDSYQEADE